MGFVWVSLVYIVINCWQFWIFFNNAFFPILGLYKTNDKFYSRMSTNLGTIDIRIFGRI